MTFLPIADYKLLHSLLLPYYREGEDVPKYVCAYGPAEAFWKKCGYRESGERAQNGLKIFVKG